MDPICASLKVNDTDSAFYGPCAQDKSTNNTMFCRKTTQVVLQAKKESMTRVIRTCGWIPYKSKTNHCLRTDNDFKLVTSCQCFADGCNLGVEIVPSRASLIVILSCIFLISNLLLK